MVPNDKHYDPDEAINILKVAKKLKLTKRGYVWIVAQSVVGPNENWLAPAEFHPGLLGKIREKNDWTNER